MSRADHEVNSLSRIVSASISAILTSLFSTPLDNSKIRVQIQGTAGECDVMVCSHCYPDNINLSTYMKQQPKSNIDLRINVNNTNFTKKTKINVQNLQNTFYYFHNGLMEHRLPTSRLEEQLINARCKNMPFKHSFEAFYKIIRYEGIRSIYSGLGVTLWMAAPATVLYYNTYDTLRNSCWYYLTQYRVRHAERLTRTQEQRLTAIENFIPAICGASGRVFAVSVIAPLELIRTQIMAKTINRDLTIFEAIKLNVASGGVFSLWKGLLPSLWRDVPFSAVFWMSYEFFKRFWIDFLNDESPEPRVRDYSKNTDVNQTFGVSYLSGATSGFLATVITQPFDTIKTIRQAELLGIRNLMTNTGTKSGLISIGRELIKRNGIAGLYLGFPARVIRVTNSCAIMVSGYEVGKHVLTLLTTNLV